MDAVGDDGVTVDDVTVAAGSLAAAAGAVSGVGSRGGASGVGWAGATVIEPAAMAWATTSSKPDPVGGAEVGGTGEAGPAGASAGMLRHAVPPAADSTRCTYAWVSG